MQGVLTVSPEQVNTHSLLTLKLPPPRSPDTSRSDGCRVFAVCSVVCLQRRLLPLFSAWPEAAAFGWLWQRRPSCWSVPEDRRHWGPPTLRLFCRPQTGAGSGFDAVACCALSGERRRPGRFLWGSRLRLQDRKKMRQELRRKSVAVTAPSGETLSLAWSRFVKVQHSSRQLTFKSWMSDGWFFPLDPVNNMFKLSDVKDYFWVVVQKTTYWISLWQLTSIRNLFPVGDWH